MVLLSIARDGVLRVLNSSNNKKNFYMNILYKMSEIDMDLYVFIFVI